MSCAVRTALITLAALALLSACGKKAPPRWVEKVPPERPGMLSVHLRPESAVIEWNAPAGGEAPDEYVVYRSADGGPFEKLDTLRRMKYVDREVSPGSVYRYRITARAGRLEGEAVLSAGAAVGGGGGPQGLVAGVSKDGVGLSWEHVSGAAGYNVYRSSSEHRFAGPPLNTVPVIGERFVDRELPVEDTYYLIRALMNSPSEGLTLEGSPSEPAGISPEDFSPSAPTGLGATPAEGKVLVYWDESPERWIKGYRIYRASGEAGEFVRIGKSMTPAYPDKDPEKGVLRYRVTAVGPGAEGPPSGPVRVEY